MEDGGYEWPLVHEFRNRAAELERLEAWWAGDQREPLAIFGRRRVGKSWLFRRFAHGKDALVLVAEQLPAHAQLTRFAADLEPFAGVRPQLPDVATLVRVLYRIARDRKLLVVLDEFPWLLSPVAADAFRDLTAIQAAMEDERDHSERHTEVLGDVFEGVDHFPRFRNGAAGNRLSDRDRFCELSTSRSRDGDAPDRDSA